jgi:coenzyme F420-dependent glucose-6-phosphate dehydrogenase
MRFGIGYKASAEQFDAVDVVSFACRAEALGFDFVAVSDHFQPFRHSDAHAAFSLACLGAIGARTRTVGLGTSVLTPTLRYHPAVVAQAFATLERLSPGRVFLGVGTGEAFNEVPATGRAWPAPRERQQRLAEAVQLIRELWSTPRLTFAGRWYRTRAATIYDRPGTPPPIYMAASAVGSAALAGRHGDGLITTSGKESSLYPTLVEAFEAGARSAGRDPKRLPRILEVKVSYARELRRARSACDWWAALGLTREEKTDIDDPVELERRADAARGRALSRFVVTDDPGRVVEALRPYRDLGFDRFLIHGPGGDQRCFLDEFASDVLPALRALE